MQTRVFNLSLANFPNLKTATGLSIVFTCVVTAFLIQHNQVATSQLPEMYRYKYFATNNKTLNNQTKEFVNEINFLKNRIAKNDGDGLDRAALAAVYLRRARTSGEVRYFLLAQQQAEQSLAALPVSNSGAILVLAEVAQAQHDFAGAKTLILKILKTQPRSSSALALKASMALATGDLKTAFGIATLLDKNAPSQSNALTLALAEEASGKDAEHTFLRALKIEQPDDPIGAARTRTLLARFYLRHGKLQLAQELLSEAIRIAPEFVQARLFLAEAQMDLGNYSDSEKNFQRVLYGRDANTLNTFNHAALRGIALLTQTRKKDATKLWQEAEQSLRQEISQGAFGHRRDLAELILERGNKNKFLEALKLAKQELPIRQDWQTLRTLAWAQFATKDLVSAQQTLHKAIQTGVQDAQLYDLASQTEMGLGNEEQAQKYLEKTKSINPSFATVGNVVSLGVN